MLLRKELQGTCQLLRWSLTQGHVPAQLSLAWLGGANNEGDLGTRTRVGKYSINLACRHMKLQTQRNVLCDGLLEVFFHEIIIFGCFSNHNLFIVWTENR